MGALWLCPLKRNITIYLQPTKKERKQMKRLFLLGTLILSLLIAPTTAFADVSERSSKSRPQIVYPYGHPTMHGWKTSIYRGKYYNRSQESWRKCVQKRESHHTYGSKSKVSSAAGAYQFLDSQWREPLAHMVYPELKKMYGKTTAQDIKKKLFNNPINKWSRAIQDQAFFTVLNYNGKWSGKKHWGTFGQTYSC